MQSTIRTGLKAGFDALSSIFVSFAADRDNLIESVRLVYTLKLEMQNFFKGYSQTKKTPSRRGFAAN